MKPVWICLFLLLFVASSSEGLWVSERRCGGIKYDPDFYLCCDDRITFPAGFGRSCCGQVNFDTSFYCCDSTGRVRLRGRC